MVQRLQNATQLRLSIDCKFHTCEQSNHSNNLIYKSMDLQQYVTDKMLLRHCVTHTEMLEEFLSHNKSLQDKTIL